MTDIDALIDEARKLFLIGIAPGGEETMAGRLIDALTTERAKVAALEAQLEAERALSNRLAGALGDIRKRVWIEDGENLVGCINDTDNLARAALNAHTAAREEPHDKG